MSKKHEHKPHQSITTEHVAELTDTLTRADLDGFAKTLDALRDSKRIPEKTRIHLAEAFDQLAELDEAGDTDILSPPIIKIWPPRLLPAIEPAPDEIESDDAPVFPVTAELQAALEADARRCCRTPHNQVIAILEAYFGLNDGKLKGSNKGGRR